MREKKSNYCSLFVCHLCHVWRQTHRAALVIMTPPKLIFHLHSRHRCSGSYCLNHIRLSKPHYTICYYSSFFLRFNKTSWTDIYGPPWGHRAWIILHPLMHCSQGFLYFAQCCFARLKRNLTKTNPTHPDILKEEFSPIWSKRHIPSTYKGHLWPKMTLPLKQSDII